jgi:hypothetical protein
VGIRTHVGVLFSWRRGGLGRGCKRICHVQCISSLSSTAGMIRNAQCYYDAPQCCLQCTRLTVQKKNMQIFW